MPVWLGKGRCFLWFPVSSGRLINMVALVPTNLESEGSWTAPGDLKAPAALKTDLLSRLPRAKLRFFGRDSQINSR